MKKLLIIAAANNFHFIKDIAEALRDEFWIDLFYLRTDPLYFGPLREAIKACDIIWVEWADGVSMELLKYSKLLVSKKVILRLHRYELFTPRTLKLIQELTDSEGYKSIDKLVFVSEYVRQIGISKFPWMAENSVVIPNLIDHTKFPMAEKRTKGYNLLFLGRVSYVKNLPLCLTMFHELLKLDSNYKLHIVGEISDPELAYYLKNFVEKTKIRDNVVLHGRVENEKLPELMADMHYIVCSSIFESQGMGIIEGMICGLKPVVFDFPGAENIYPAGLRWFDRNDFVWSILNPDYDSQVYREYAISRFSILNNIQKYKNLIEGI